MSEKYTIEEDVPELSELGAKFEEFAKERREYKKEYWADIAPREAEEYFDNLANSFTKWLSTEVIDLSQSDDNYVGGSENIGFQDDVEVEIREVVEYIFSNLVKEADDEKEIFESMWEVFSPLFPYAERNTSWPHVVGAITEQLSRRRSKQFLSRVGPEPLLSLVENNAATNHTYRVISFLVEDAGTEFYEISDELALSIVHRRESGDEPDVGLLALIDIFNTFIKKHPDNVIRDHSAVLRQTLRIAGDESVQHATRKAALEGIRSLVEQTTSANSIVSEEVTALQSVIETREIELVSLACDIIVQADVRDECLRDPLEELEKAIDIDLLLRVKRAFATLDGKQQSALQAIEVKTNGSKSELLQQLGGNGDALVRAHAAAAIDLSAQEYDLQKIVRQMGDPDSLVFECLCRSLEDILLDQYENDVITNLVKELLIRVTDENTTDREILFCLRLLIEIYHNHPSIVFDNVQEDKKADILTILNISDHYEMKPILTKFAACHLDYWDTTGSYPGQTDVDEFLQKCVELVQSVSTTWRFRGVVFRIIDSLWLNKEITIEDVELFFDPAVETAEAGISEDTNSSELYTKACGLKIVADIAYATENNALLPTVFEGFADIGTEYRSIIRRTEDPHSDVDSSLIDGVVTVTRAIHLLGKFDVPTETCKGLIWLVDNGDNASAKWAVKALGAIGGEKAMDKLNEISGDPDYSTTIRREVGVIMSNSN